MDEDPRLHPRDEPDVPRERYFTDEQSLQRKITRAPRDRPLRASTEYRDDRSSRREELTIPASSSTGKEKRYAKRPRKKTRPDRYDTRKHNSKPSKQRETTRKQHRRKERKKELRSGKEVMQNFSSNALSNDRVIVSFETCDQQNVVPNSRQIKPSFAAGLFSNARIPNSTHGEEAYTPRIQVLVRLTHHSYRPCFQRHEFPCSTSPSPRAQPEVSRERGEEDFERFAGRGRLFRLQTSPARQLR